MHHAAQVCIFLHFLDYLLVQSSHYQPDPLLSNRLSVYTKFTGGLLVDELSVVERKYEQGTIHVFQALVYGVDVVVKVKEVQGAYLKG